MILPLGRRFGGLFGLLAQLGATAFWLWLGTAPIAAWRETPRLHNVPDTIFAAVMTAIPWMLAVGILYGLYRQRRNYQENVRLLEWLKLNGESIRAGRRPMFYAGRHITWNSELVCHHIVFSFIFISFRSKTRWLIRDQQPRRWLAASLYTFTYGWWGVPGIVWTPLALVKNIKGLTTIRVRDIIEPPAKPVAGSLEQL